MLPFLLVLVLWSAAALSTVSAEAPVPGTGPWNLTLFHTNDTHGAFLSEPATWREDRAEVGGVVALSWWLEREGRGRIPSLLLDAGDFMTGNPICEIEIEGVRGAGVVDLMNALGYDAGVIGNHEFDNGRTNLRALAARSAHPKLAADILDERGEPEFRAEPVVLRRGDLRIGVIGVSCSSLMSVVPDRILGGLSLRDQETVVREQAAVLDPRTDLMILITHNGRNDDVELAHRLAGSGIDVIVGGHSHSRLRQPLLEGGILVVQAGGHLKNLGRLDLRVAEDRVVSYDGRLIPLLAAGATAPAPVDSLVRHYEAAVAAEFDRVIGHLAVDWRRDRGEHNLGNWLTDRLRERAGADVAFLNSGGIRANLVAGPVTMLDVYEILPFSNTLVTFELTGEQLLTVLQQNAEADVFDRYGVLQVSGLCYGFRRVGDHVELEEVTVEGRPLRRDTVYTAAAPDYVLSMADRYFNQPAPPSRDSGVTIRDAVIDAVCEHEGGITARTDGRMTRLDDGGDNH